MASAAEESDTGPTRSRSFRHLAGDVQLLEGRLVVITTTWTGNASSSSLAMSCTVDAYPAALTRISVDPCRRVARASSRQRRREGAALDERHAQIVVEGGKVARQRRRGCRVSGGRCRRRPRRDRSGAAGVLSCVHISAICTASISPNSGPTSTLVKKSPARPNAERLVVVVAVDGIVERQLHERGDRHRSRAGDERHRSRREGLLHAPRLSPTVAIASSSARTPGRRRARPAGTPCRRSRRAAARG